eukprot:g5604.t1
MSNAFLPLAKRLVKEAKQAYLDEDFEKTCDLLEKAVQRYSFALKREKDPRKQEKIKRAITRHSKRIQELRPSGDVATEKEVVGKPKNDYKKREEKIRLRVRRRVDRQNDRFRKRIASQRLKEEEPLDQIVISSVDKLRTMLQSDVVTAETNLNARFGWAVKRRRSSCGEEKTVAKDMFEASCEMMHPSIFGIELRPGKWKVRAICHAKRAHYLRANDILLIKKTLSENEEYVMNQINLDVKNGLVQITGDAEIVALEFFPLQFLRRESLKKKKVNVPKYWCQVNITEQDKIFFGAWTKIHTHYTSNVLKTGLTFSHEEPSSAPVRISFGRSSTLQKGWINSERNIPKIDYLEFAFASDHLHPSLQYEREQNRLVDLKFKLYHQRVLPLLMDADDSEKSTGYLLRLGLWKRILKEYVSYSIGSSKLSSHSWMLLNLNSSDEIMRDMSGRLDLTKFRENIHVIKWRTKSFVPPKLEYHYKCLTIEVIVVTRQLSQSIIQCVSDVDRTGWCLEIENGCVEFSLFSEKNGMMYRKHASIISLTPLMKGVATHVAVTIGNGNEPRLYINGRLDIESNNTGFGLYHLMTSTAMRLKFSDPKLRTACACMTFGELGPDEFKLLT